MSFRFSVWAFLSLAVALPAESGTLTFSAAEDAFVYQAEASKNYGAWKTFEADASPVLMSLLKFKVSGVGTQKVTRARLRLYSVKGSPQSGGKIHVISSAWTEMGVTFSNKPAFPSTAIAQLGPVLEYKPYEVDVTSAITGDGVFSLGISNPTTYVARYSSREAGANGPQLILDVSSTTSSPSPSPQPSSSPSASPSPSATPVPPSGVLKVFPGAVGFGTETKAGRGGKVFVVKSLANSGTGTLREAIDATGPRTIVFEVAGTITATSLLVIKSGNITIAGQTAPPPGITIKGAGILIQAADVLIQHLKVRVGDAEGLSSGNRDGISVSTYANRVVMDHVSVSWATDENASIGAPSSATAIPENVTFSNNIISEGLYCSIHPDGCHSMGSLLRRSKNVSLIGNLYAHNSARNPFIQSAANVMVANNILYNTLKYATILQKAADGDPAGPVNASVVGNVYIGGPNSVSGWNPIRVVEYLDIGSKLYVLDNKGPGQSSDPWSMVNIKTPQYGDIKASSPPIWVPGFKAAASAEVESLVLSRAGARPAERDAIDARVVQEVRSRTGAIINSQGENAWPTATATRPFPMPASPNGDDDGDGYTNLEEVLHQMAYDVEN